MRIRLWLAFIIILLLSLSCNLTLPISQSQAPEGDPVATWVAGTLAARPVEALETPAEAGAGSPTNTAPALEQPTLEPLGQDQPTQEAAPAEVTAQASLESPPPAGYDTSKLRVAYAMGGELHLWTDGAGDALLYNGEPVADVLLSEDGWVVVFTTRNADYLFSGLWRVNADGSDLRRLMDASVLLPFSTNPSAEGVAPNQMEFVPGSRWLAFNTRLVFMGPGLVIQDDLRMVNTSSGEMRTVVEAGLGGAFTYSPDGSLISLVTPTSVSLIDADGSNRRSNLVTYPMIMTYSEYQYYPKVTWEQDGSALWVVVPSEDSLALDASMAFWRIPAVDSAPALMASYPFDLSLFFSGQVLSPDLQKTIYLSRSDPNANLWTLHFARLDGSAEFPIHTGNLRFETWSPDSNWMTIEQDGEVWVGDPTGNFSSLAGVSQVIEIEWVDAEHFLFLSGDYETMQLNLGSLTGPSLVIGTAMNGYLPFDFSIGGG